MKTIYIFASVMVVFVIAIITVFVISQTTAGDIIQPPTFQILSNILSLGSVITSAIFSFLLVKQGYDIKNHNDTINSRAEAFRELQFIASNHIIVDYVDHFLLYREAERYVKRVKATQDFRFYLREKDIDIEDVKANFDNYFYLTVTIPIRVVVGQAVSSIQFKRLRLERTDKVHNFVPCQGNNTALILYNEETKTQEVHVNLIAKKEGEFYSEDIVNPLTKIKLLSTMQSFLGVSVTGWTELYFTNPQKLEKDGTNKYKINSSQFQISGLPTLKPEVTSDISDQVS